MAVQKALARVGIAKQVAKGTPATNPAYAFGVRSGSTFGIDIAQEAETRTQFDSLNSPGANRTLATPKLDFETRGFARMIGLLLLGALGAEAAVTGSGPFVHTFTPATTLPWFTLFGDYGGGVEYERISDALLDSLEISWEGSGPAVVKCGWKGITPTWPGAFGTVGTDDSLAAYLRAGGGVFQLDAASGTPVTAPIKSGSVSINNNLDVQEQATTVTPGDIVPSHQQIACSFTLTPAANFNEWRKTVTGSASGTAVQESPVDGSFNVKFAIDANTDLAFTALHCAFLSDFPDADPGGGAAEVVLEGEAYRQTGGGAALTAVLRNTVAAVY